MKTKRTKKDRRTKDEYNAELIFGVTGLSLNLSLEPEDQNNDKE